MARVYEASAWRSYVMSWHSPHRCLEPLNREMVVVDQAPHALVAAGVLAGARYDREKMAAH